MNSIKARLLAASSALVIAAGFVQAAHAETILIGDEVTVAKSDVARPTGGMSMMAVEAKFGSPVERHPAVGGDSPKKPPITRWDYNHFAVFFEKDRVIDAVVIGPNLPADNTPSAPTAEPAPADGAAPAAPAPSAPAAAPSPADLAAPVAPTPPAAPVVEQRETSTPPAPAASADASASSSVTSSAQSTEPSESSSSSESGPAAASKKIPAPAVDPILLGAPAPAPEPELPSTALPAPGTAPNSAIPAAPPPNN